MLVKPKKIREIYFDHAATTPVDKRVVEVMMLYFSDVFGNPSALYRKGREANAAVNQSRRAVAEVLGALPENIIFTGSGTESDNLAIFGVANAHEKQGKHIITTAIEHHAVLRPLEFLEKQGWEITYLKVNQEGLINLKDLKEAIRPDTVLVSVMYANNEIGVIEPVADIGRLILKYRKENNTPYPFFHTDACQAAGYLDLNVEKTHVDLMTVNGGKIYGPKGVGALYLRRGVKIQPMILGGDQEKRTRAGTENVPAIVGLGEALRLASGEKEKEAARLRELSAYLWEKISEKIPDVSLNGPKIGENRLPNNVNIVFKGIEGESLLLYLDEYGISCSTGSACASGSLDPSHVLTAIGLPYEYSHGSLRFSLGKSNSKKDIDYLMEYLPGIVEQLREISPAVLGKKQHAKYKKLN